MLARQLPAKQLLLSPLDGNAPLFRSDVLAGATLISDSVRSCYSLGSLELIKIMLGQDC